MLRPLATRLVNFSNIRTSKRSIRSLRDSFKDPSSPFYLAPHTQGPSSPGPGFENPEGAVSPGDPYEHDPHLNPAAAEHARQIAIANGYDPLSFWEQPVVWIPFGMSPEFKLGYAKPTVRMSHVNNVRYLRFCESGRTHWMRSWRKELGILSARDILAGKGVGVILKSIDVKFKRPVLYPDTLLISHKPHSPTSKSFGCKALIQSYGQGKIVAESDSVLVWYDYENLRKCEPPSEFSQMIQQRMKGNSMAST